MKKTLKIGIAAISCATVFALTACGSATVSTSIAPNWYADTTLNTSISNTYEKLSYKVTYEKGSNEDYQVAYQEGTYTVVLENSTYNNEAVYKLTSSLQIEGSYTLGSDTLSFTDSVASECYFHSAGQALYPLYSKKTVHSTTPLKNNPTSLEDAVAQYEYTMEVTYNLGDNSATSVYTDLKDSSKNTEQTYSLKDNLTVLDNESLLFAVRGVSLDAQVTESAYVLNPYNKTQEIVNIVLAGQGTQAKYSFKNLDQGDTATKEYTMDVNVVQISRNQTLGGKTVTAYYAAKTAPNDYRCVMVKMENPLSYNMGKLVYTLTEADFTNK
ncbi:MAG: hypothetical protein IJY26_03140 [Clostridia bacterium]|nr:hypothetical protein [Clostridia bacterium]